MKKQEQALIQLGNKIKTLRKALGVSQEELAFRSEIDVSFLSLIERGVGNPSYLILLRIAAALQVTIKFLIEVE